LSPLPPPALALLLPARTGKPAARSDNQPARAGKSKAKAGGGKGDKTAPRPKAVGKAAAGKSKVGAAASAARTGRAGRRVARAPLPKKAAGAR